MDTRKKIALANAKHAKAKMEATIERKERARWFWVWQAYVQTLEEMKRDEEIELEHARRLVTLDAAWRSER